MSQVNERRIVYELVPADVVAMAQAARFNARQVPGHKEGSAVLFALSEGQMNRGCFNANHVALKVDGVPIKGDTVPPPGDGRKEVSVKGTLT